MNKFAFIVGVLVLSFDAHANCLLDAPEIGDIGPDSGVVCRELEPRFPGSTIAIENRSIHSPESISVLVSVNAKPMAMRYELSGAAWRLSEGVGATVQEARPEKDVSMR